MTNECTCPLGADECTGDSGVFYPLQDGGMCATRQCQKPQQLDYQAACESVGQEDHGEPL